MADICTDKSGIRFPERCVALMDKRPEDGSLDDLFDAAGGDLEVHFAAEDDMLEWFGRGGIHAESMEGLRSGLDEKYVRVYEYDCSWQEE